MRYGILGAGNIAHAFSTALKGLNLTREAIGSRDIDRAQAFKKTYGFKKAYDSYDALLDDKAVDCVYIATPHSFHFEHVMKALDKGKHVICEKPIALNHVAATKLYEYAASLNLLLVEALWTKFSPLTNHLKTNIYDYIGHIKTLKVDFSFKGDFDPNNRLYNIHLGGGALLDVGIYPVTYANLFLGKPKSIKTEMTLSTTGVDVTSTIDYIYDNQTAHMTISIAQDGPRDAIFKGDKGIIKVPFFWGAETAYLYDLDMNLIKEITFKNKINGYEYEIESFEKSVKERLLDSPFHKAVDAIEVFKQLDQIRAIWGLTYPEERGY
jgi:predicted dehydrogenase